MTPTVMSENAESGNLRDRQSRPDIRERLEDILVRLVRLYTFNTPIAKGKYRLMEFALGLCRYLPKTVEGKMHDGRRISLDVTREIGGAVYFLGEYEKAVSSIVSELVDPGDVCVDIGANFGWYTTLLANLCGPAGIVHAFEPVPATFLQLTKNVGFLSERSQVRLNNLALGDFDGTVEIHIFDDLGLGFSSLSNQGRDSSTPVQCRMTTLDNYLAQLPAAESAVNFLKIDVEGAELMFFKGASRLFEQGSPPIILAEMAVKQSANFGYHPNDLIDHIASLAAYDFYAVNEFNGDMTQITKFAAADVGANVFCIPRGEYPKRAERVKRRFTK